MLNNDTKKRIDNCRDILVGKLPDPKSQVEQITIALIYKFMDDMDRESEELGGVARFFTDKFEQYKWSNIMDLKKAGQEKLNLYAEGIEKMTENSKIPSLFRDIFKNAYLPYKDPETFRLFSKEINEFSYEHSEELGNAFEYLLSIMSSQGDAGQFRTPRHIIDFIVNVVEPKKGETILDPACGTAGFLISSYKYIQEQNKKNGLTPDEQDKLTKNIVGYDISPDMVRLSLVNLYLHHFLEPQIFEYDTLTSEDRWNENFDVILANPPFMTPKGGIKPHSKFGIKANRSEVLFVDYIMEHMNSKGRAGIIVPEGIIFQSANAYKSLRKKLIEDKFLWAVVSLPSGVFNPYSGVKTSILLLDREMAKKTDKVLFVKVDNDGYDLGAQRKENKKDNLPEAIDLLMSYKNAIYSNNEKELEIIDSNAIAVIVEKSKLSEKKEYNLSMDRYKEIIVHKHTNWKMIELERVFKEINNGKNVEQIDEIGKYRVTRIQTISNGTINLEKTKWTNEEVDDNYFMQEGDILLSHINSFEHLGKSSIFSNINEKVVHGINLIKLRPDKEIMNPYYISKIFKSEIFIENVKKFAQKAVNQASVKISDLKNIKIPCPPISVQNEIVEEIESYQKIIDGAKAIVDNWKPIITIDKDWEMVELGKVCEVNFETENPNDKYGDKEFYYYDISSVENYTGVCNPSLVKGSEAPSRARRKIKNGDVLLSTVRPNLKAFTYLKNVPENSLASTGFSVLSENGKANNGYIYYMLFSDILQKQMIDRMGKGAYPSINQKDVNELKIPLPNIEIQIKIFKEIDEEKKIVEANKRLIEIYEKKIKDKIDEVWGE